MALLTSNDRHGTGPLGGLRADLRARYESWKVYRATRRELGRLTDRELSDLGLSRASIDDVARSAARGH